MRLGTPGGYQVDGLPPARYFKLPPYPGGDFEEILGGALRKSRGRLCGTPGGNLEGILGETLGKAYGGEP